MNLNIAESLALTQTSCYSLRACLVARAIQDDFMHTDFAQERMQRWIYAADGRNASRAQDGGTAVLTGEHPSRREQPRPNPRVPQWQGWMSTLSFKVVNGKFAFEIEVERQNVVTVDSLTEAESYFHIVWKVDYPTIRVSVAGGAPQSASDLSYEDWLEFDLLILGLLRDWPTRADEAGWLDEHKRNDRILFVLGGWVGGTWDHRFARTFDSSIMHSSAVTLRRIWRRDAYATPQQKNTHGWERIMGAAGIFNARTGSRLTYEGRIPPVRPMDRRSHVLLQFEGAGYTLPIPTVVPAGEYDPPVWTTNLPYALLMARGWSLERIEGARSDEDRQALSQAVEDTVPARPLEAAALVNAVIDALLHWQHTENPELLPAPAISLVAVTNSWAYWPLHLASASMDQTYFKMF